MNKKNPETKGKKSKEELIIPQVVSRDEIVRERIKELVQDIGDKYLALAFNMHEVWANTYFIKYGHSTFKAYCENEALISYGKAKRLVAISEKVASLHLRPEDVEEIGWTKMSLIEGVIDQKNKDSLMKRAKEKTVMELAEDVRVLKDGIVKEVTLRTITLTVRMTEDQSTIVMEAINSAKEKIGSEDLSLALEHICYDYAMSSENQTSIPFEKAVAYVEKTYGVVLKVDSHKGIGEIVEESDG